MGQMDTKPKQEQNHIIIFELWVKFHFPFFTYGNFSLNPIIWHGFSAPLCNNKSQVVFDVHSNS